MPTIKGIPYEPILSPEERIVSFLDDLATKPQHFHNKDMKRGIEHAIEIAKVWFRDEVKALELAEQKQATEV